MFFWLSFFELLYLSRIMTGLRGGNLLFHLRKLQDSGTVLQRKEWGDYVISDKGYQILKMVVECHFRLIL
jgi:hypothetical protein